MNENLKELNTQVAAYERIAEIMLYPTEFEKDGQKEHQKIPLQIDCHDGEAYPSFRGETASGTAYAIPDAYVKASPYDRLFQI